MSRSLLASAIVLAAVLLLAVSFILWRGAGPDASGVLAPSKHEAAVSAASDQTGEASSTSLEPVTAGEDARYLHKDADVYATFEAYTRALKVMDATAFSTLHERLVGHLVDCAPLAERQFELLLQSFEQDEKGTVTRENLMQLFGMAALADANYLASLVDQLRARWSTHRRDNLARLDAWAELDRKHISYQARLAIENWDSWITKSLAYALWLNGASGATERVKYVINLMQDPFATDEDLHECPDPWLSAVIYYSHVLFRGNESLYSELLNPFLDLVAGNDVFSLRLRAQARLASRLTVDDPYELFERIPSALSEKEAARLVAEFLDRMGAADSLDLVIALLADSFGGEKVQFILLDAFFAMSSLKDERTFVKYGHEFVYLFERAEGNLSEELMLLGALSSLNVAKNSALRRLRQSDGSAAWEGLLHTSGERSVSVFRRLAGYAARDDESKLTEGQRWFLQSNLLRLLDDLDAPLSDRLAIAAGILDSADMKWRATLLPPAFSALANLPPWILESERSLVVEFLVRGLTGQKQWNVYGKNQEFTHASALGSVLSSVRILGEALGWPEEVRVQARVSAEEISAAFKTVRGSMPESDSAQRTAEHFAKSQAQLAAALSDG